MSPKNIGGQGGSFFQTILAIEELAKVDPSASVIVDVQNTLCNSALRRWGTDDQKRRFLPQARAGHGGVLCAFRSRVGIGRVCAGGARRRGRRRVTGSPAASCGSPTPPKPDLFLVFANADPAEGYRGITAFLVERGTPGLAVGKKEDKLGIRASSTCEVILDDCRVPKENVLGEVGKGYKVAIETLNEGRIGIAAQMTGLAQGALDHALAYSKQRKQFGKPIADFQGVQFDLAEMAVDVEASRLMTYNAARLRDAGLPFVTEAAMAKYFASQVAERVASRAVEVLGGVGFTKDFRWKNYIATPRSAASTKAPATCSG